MPDYLPGSSTACYQVCTLLGPTTLPQNAGTLYPDTSPPTDNSLAPVTTDLFQVWQTGFPPTTDCLPASSTAFYKVSTLLEPTALPQNVGTLYPDISPPTDNSLAINHRPFPGMENRFSTNCGLPSCLFHCLLQSLHTPWTGCQSTRTQVNSYPIPTRTYSTRTQRHSKEK